MRLKRIKIGKYETENNVFFAPLAGFSDSPMREICLSFGAGLAFTEMVSAKGILYENENTKDLLTVSPAEKIKCAQLFGNDPCIMRQAAESEYLSDFDVLDVNFGCPMPKIYNNGEGSALLKEPKLAEKIISECKKSGKAVTCKIRVGLTDGDFLGKDLAKAAEQGGADLITVHGRPKERIYAGEVDYDKIAEIKKSVSVPVIANGGVFSEKDADILSERTGADGVMIARGALEDPFIFSRITETPPFLKDKEELIYRHLDMLKNRYGDELSAVRFRKQLCLYIKGMKNSVSVKQKLAYFSDCDTIKKAVAHLFHGEKAEKE